MRAILGRLATILLDNRLVQSPTVNQRAINAEMLIAGVRGPFLQDLMR